MNRACLLRFLFLLALTISQVSLCAQAGDITPPSPNRTTTVLALTSKQQARLATNPEIELTWAQSNVLKRASGIRVYKLVLVDSAQLARETKNSVFNVCLRHSVSEIEVPHEFLIPPEKAKWREEQLNSL